MAAHVRSGAALTPMHLFRTAFVLAAAGLLDPVAPLRAAGADTLWQEWQLTDPSLVAQVHQAGCRIIAWTVNDADAAAALSAMGVDGLCGNYPERLSSP